MIASSLHCTIALISAHFDVLVRLGIVHRQEQVICSNPVHMCVPVGEQTTLSKNDE